MKSFDLFFKIKLKNLEADIQNLIKNSKALQNYSPLMVKFFQT